jgi:Zn-dependent peptidase ImmA (M78 family)
MPLTSSFYSKIEQQVAELLKAVNILQAPVPVDQIARFCGAVVLPYELGNEVSGVLVYEESRGTIGYNASHSTKRQRFTIGHELAHLLLHVNKHKSKDLFVDKDFIVKWRYNKIYSQKEFEHEQEANAFAAALLMPKEFLIKEMQKEKYAEMTEIKLIEELAKVFQVSIQAMTYRFADLNKFAYAT